MGNPEQKVSKRPDQPHLREKVVVLQTGKRKNVGSSGEEGRLDAESLQG